MRSPFSFNSTGITNDRVISPTQPHNSKREKHNTKNIATKFRKIRRLLCRTTFRDSYKVILSAKRNGNQSIVKIVLLIPSRSRYRRIYNYRSDGAYRRRSIRRFSYIDSNRRPRAEKISTNSNFRSIVLRRSAGTKLRKWISNCRIRSICSKP